MPNNEEIMTAAEFFCGVGKEMNTPSRKTRPRGKRKPDDLFADVKVKMVMRIHGVSRAKALEIISAYAAEKAAGDGEEARPRDERIMSADEFFGNV